MARTDPQINIKIPVELKKELKLKAVKNGRSLNTEVLTLLELATSSDKKDISRFSTEEIIEELTVRLNGLQITVNPINKDG